MKKLIQMMTVVAMIAERLEPRSGPDSRGAWASADGSRTTSGLMCCRHHRLPITIGDLEHFDTYITEKDIAYIREMGFDHVRLGFDQIVLEEAPGKYRERTFKKLDDFVGGAKSTISIWC